MLFKNWFLSEAMRYGDNLALFKESNFLCLYRTGSEIPRILRTWSDSLEDYLYGAIDLRDNSTYQTWEIDSIWAKPGYGPYLYLVGMTVAGDRGLAPNRALISEPAKKVWQKFYESNLATAIPLPEGAWKHHKEPYLNYKYTINSPINLSKMIARSNITFRNDKDGELRETFWEMAEGILKDKMSDIY